MSGDPITWQTTHGDTVEVYLATTHESDGWLSGLRVAASFRYRVRAANNRIVETGSEGYTRRRAAVKAAERHHPRVGNDGLTDAERAAYAESWRNGAGRTPSKDEMKLYRELGAKLREKP